MARHINDGEWWYLPVAAVLFVGVFSLISKGCSYLSGVYPAREFQQQQFDEMPLPSSTACRERFVSGNDSSKAWSSQWCRTSLTDKEIMDFYKKLFQKRGWMLNTHLKQSLSYENQVFELNWDKNTHQFTLAVLHSKENVNEFIYELKIRWGKSLGSRLKIKDKDS